MSEKNQFAIIQSGGKQYRVEAGDVIDVELLEQEAGSIQFSEILLFNDGNQTKVGAPFLSNLTVKGEILGEIRGPKVIAFKYKRRKNYRRKVGHRQNYTRIKITEFAL